MEQTEDYISWDLNETNYATYASTESGIHIYSTSEIYGKISWNIASENVHAVTELTNIIIN